MIHVLWVRIEPWMTKWMKVASSKYRSMLMTPATTVRNKFVISAHLGIGWPAHEPICVPLGVTPGNEADKRAEPSKADKPEVAKREDAAKKEEAGKKEPDRKKKVYNVDQDLLSAFRYFDRTGAAPWCTDRFC